MQAKLGMQINKGNIMNNELLKIAQTVLSLETLETQNSDSLDFQEHAVWMIKEALEQAYKKGQESVKKGV